MLTRRNTRRPVERQVARAVADSDGAAQEGDRVALQRLERDATRRLRCDGSEENEAEAKTADDASESL